MSNQKQIEQQIAFLRRDRDAVRNLLEDMPEDWIQERIEFEARVRRAERDLDVLVAQLSASQQHPDVSREVEITLRNHEKVYGSRGADPQVLGGAMIAAGKLIDYVAVQRQADRARGRTGRRSAPSVRRVVPPTQVVPQLVTGSFGFRIEIEGPETESETTDFAALDEAIDLVTHVGSDDDEAASRAVGQFGKNVRGALKQLFGIVGNGSLSIKSGASVRQIPSEGTRRAWERLVAERETEDEDFELVGAFLSVNRKRWFEFRPDDGEPAPEISGVVASVVDESELEVLRANTLRRMKAKLRCTTAVRGEKQKTTWVLVGAEHVSEIADDEPDA